MDTKSTNSGEFSLRALIWSGCGAFLGVRGNNLAKLALAGPIVEQLTGLKLEDIIASLLRDNYNRNHLQQRPKNSPATIPETDSLFSSDAKEKTVSFPASAQYVNTVSDSKWLEVIPHPSVVLALGRRGSGKSALGHRLLELSRFRSLPFVLGMPQHVLKDLPEWLGVINDATEAPVNSTLLVDEAYLRFNARESQKEKSREISRIVNLSRQKQQTLIFVSQQARTIDKNIASTADVLIIKEPEPLQVEFERREINEIVKLTAEKFHNIKKDRRKWSMVYSPARNFLDMLTNELPSYWNDRLSRVYALSGPASTQKPARKASTTDKIRQAKLLNNMGLPVTQIMRDIGVRSRTTVYKYLAMPDESVQSD